MASGAKLREFGKCMTTETRLKIMEWEQAAGKHYQHCDTAGPIPSDKDSFSGIGSLFMAMQGQRLWVADSRAGVLVFS